MAQLKTGTSIGGITISAFVQSLLNNADADAFLTDLDIASLTAAAKTLLALTAVQGDIPYASVDNVISMLAKSTDGKIVRQASNIPSWSDVIVSGTVVASTSGVAIDFTSIPSWAKQITINFYGVSTNGVSPIVVQIGDSGGIEATGYTGGFGLVAAAGANAYAGTTYFPVTWSTNADARTANGSVQLSLIDAALFTWALSGAIYQTTADYAGIAGGVKALSAALDRVRITTANGTDAFDAGAINILYE